MARSVSTRMRWIKVWDPLVRILHWTLVATYFIVFASGGELKQLHYLTGEFLLIVIAIRVVWGLVGTRYARFTEFVRRPSVVREYVQSLKTLRPKHYTGHNPAGGLMIVIMLVTLLATGGTGYWAEVSHIHTIKHIHEALANVTMALIVVHVGGVVVSSVLHGENLIRAMITGRKRRFMTVPEAG